MLPLGLVRLAVLLGAAPTVTVPTGRTTTVVAVPTARVVVPAGSFPMGATAEDVKLAKALCAEELRAGGALTLDLPPRCGSRFDAESPQSDVFLPAFAIDRTEVTLGAFAACVRRGACHPAFELVLNGDPQLPVERVTFDEAAAFCRFRGGRLPSEAEWEKAARGPDHRTWPWGNEWVPRRANCGRAEHLGPGGQGGQNPTDDTVDDSDGFAARAPVGSFPAGASPYGVLDMVGNVWEWTSGYFTRDPPQGLARVSPRGPPSGTERTIRGGSYRAPPSDLRVMRRFGLAPTERQSGVGFRCVYDLP